jgi:hypothetical protein
MAQKAACMPHIIFVNADLPRNKQLLGKYLIIICAKFITQILGFFEPSKRHFSNAIRLFSKKTTQQSC